MCITDRTKEVLEKYNRLVQETAEFMYSFATYDELEGRYVLKDAQSPQLVLLAIIVA